MDIRMPQLDGLTAARQLLASGDSRILILTTFDADEYVYETLRMGASGFLLKDAPPDQLISAVRSAAAGNALIDPAVTRILLKLGLRDRVQAVVTAYESGFIVPDQPA
jgi:DNA-binding NarL/FixJ family response regulator